MLFFWVDGAHIPPFVWHEVSFVSQCFCKRYQGQGSLERSQSSGAWKQGETPRLFSQCSQEDRLSTGQLSELMHLVGPEILDLSKWQCQNSLRSFIGEAFRNRGNRAERVSRGNRNRCNRAERVSEIVSEGSLRWPVRGHLWEGVKQGRFVILAFLPQFYNLLGGRYWPKTEQTRVRLSLGSGCVSGRFWGGILSKLGRWHTGNPAVPINWSHGKEPLAADFWCKLFVSAEWRSHLYRNRSSYGFLTPKKGKCLQMSGHKSRNPFYCHFRNR